MHRKDFNEFNCQKIWKIREETSWIQLKLTGAKKWKFLHSNNLVGTVYCYHYHTADQETDPNQRTLVPDKMFLLRSQSDF